MLLIDNWYTTRLTYSLGGQNLRLAHLYNCSGAPQARALTISERFNSLNAIYASPDMERFIDVSIRRNSKNKKSQFHADEPYTQYSDRDFYPRKMRHLLENHPNILIQILLHEGNDFEGWSKYIDDDYALRTENIETLPPTPPEKCGGNATLQTIQSNDSEICLPINPRELFEGLFLARDHGCALEFRMPEKQGENGTLDIITPSASLIKKKKFTRL